MTLAANRVDVVLSQVRSYTGLGLHVLPIWGIIDGRCACGNEACDRPGKHPLLERGVYSASTDYEWLESIYNEDPYSNVGIATGRISGVLFLDLDTQEAIDQARRVGLPKTWAFVTGKGEQYVFKYPVLLEDSYVQNAVQLGPGLDIRSDGGYSVVPVSTHYSGKEYAWINPPETTELASIPKWLMDRLIIKNKTASSSFKMEEETEIQEEGGRNEYLFKIGTSLRASRLSGEEIRLVLHERNMRSCSPPLSEEEVNKISESITQRYAPGIDDDISDAIKEKLGEIDKLPKILLTAPLTDSGNSECLVELFSNDFRYCRTVTKNKSDSKGMFHWNGSIWEEDLGREFRDCAKWTARGRRTISSNAETVELRRKLFIYATMSENLRKLEDMCNLASTNPRLVVDAEVWDSSPLKLSVENGTIDLESGQFLVPNRDDYITKQANVRYEEFATCPIWEQTLSEIFRDNPAIVPYLQRVFGYCLTGLTDQHIMWFWYGSGANGKSTILNTMKLLLGNFAATTSFSTFDTKNDNGRNDGLAELRGTRFVAASEGEQGRSIAEAKIKAVVSNDGVSCRFLFNNLFTYIPTYKVILASNHLPSIRGTDKGIWRRVHIVPFNQVFDKTTGVDLHLEEKLEAELPGILNWCLAGLQDFWEKDGFDPPEVVLYSTRNLETQSDLFQQWFDERLTPSANNTLKRSPAYLDYRNYLRTSGESPIPKIEWTTRMEKQGAYFTEKVRGDLAAKGWRLDSELY